MEETLEQKTKKIDKDVLKTIGRREVLIKRYGLTACLESEDNSEEVKNRKPMMMITNKVGAEIGI